MPLHQIKTVSDTSKVGVWKITESVNELKLSLENKGFNTSQLLNTKNEQRLKQWLAIRLLLYYFFDHYELNYDKLGKPHLNNKHTISISHSGNYAVVIVDKKNNCGIDIEKISPKVERIKHKFLNENDLTNYSSLKDLTTLWCAKESLYKYYGKKEVLFIEHLSIKDFNPPQKSFNGIIKINNTIKNLRMRFDEIEDFILVYTY